MLLSVHGRSTYFMTHEEEFIRVIPLVSFATGTEDKIVFLQLALMLVSHSSRVEAETEMKNSDLN